MSETQTHWRKVIRRKNDHLLFAEDIGPSGASVDVEVIDSGVLKVTGADGKTDDLPWIAFAGKDGKPRKKRLALNATNCKTMQAVTGSGIVENWRGPITLVVITTTFRDQKTKQMVTTDAIRIASTRPRHAPSVDSAPAEDQSR